MIFRWQVRFIVMMTLSAILTTIICYNVNKKITHLSWIMWCVVFIISISIDGWIMYNYEKRKFEEVVLEKI